MHPMYIATKTASAQERMTTAAQSIAETMNLSSSLVNALSAPEKDKALAILHKTEAAASLLEAIQAGLSQTAPEPITETLPILPPPVIDSLQRTRKSTKA